MPRQLPPVNIWLSLRLQAFQGKHGVPSKLLEHITTLIYIILRVCTAHLANALFWQCILQICTLVHVLSSVKSDSHVTLDRIRIANGTERLGSVKKFMDGAELDFGSSDFIDYMPPPPPCHITCGQKKPFMTLSSLDRYELWIENTRFVGALRAPPRSLRLPRTRCILLQ